mmetsp:Transcript_21264/g.39680  ORF Transcript_21264/g.39680 Transcript_21264/m.39680 type:complete len:410 (+) Transcript_21264:469-1698(+)
MIPYSQAMKKYLNEFKTYVENCKERYVGDLADPINRQRMIMVLAALVIVMQGGFLFAAHSQIQWRSEQLHQELVHVHNQYALMHPYASIEVMPSSKSSYQEKHSSWSSSYPLELQGQDSASDGLVKAHEQQSQRRLQILQHELRQMQEQNEAALLQNSDTIRETIDVVSHDIMQALLSLQQNTTIQYEFRKKHQNDGLYYNSIPLLVALLMIAGGWFLEKRQEQEWNATLESSKERERRYKNELEEMRQSKMRIEKEKEYLILKMQDLEVDVRKWKTDCAALKQQNKKLKEISGPVELTELRREFAKMKNVIKALENENTKLKEGDVKQWEAELKKAQEENQKLREFTGPAEMEDLRREYAKLKCDIKELESKNAILMHDNKKVKLERNKKVKNKNRGFTGLDFSFKSL